MGKRKEFYLIAKVWKQIKCQSTEEWINKNTVYTYNGILFSHQSHQIFNFCFSCEYLNSTLSIFQSYLTPEQPKFKLHRLTYTWNFFSPYILQYYMIQGWLNLQMWNHRYGIWAGILLQEELASLTCMLFKGQYHIGLSTIT